MYVQVLFLRFILYYHRNRIKCLDRQVMLALDWVGAALAPPPPCTREALTVRAKTTSGRNPPNCLAFSACVSKMCGLWGHGEMHVCLDSTCAAGSEVAQLLCNSLWQTDWVLTSVLCPPPPHPPTTSRRMDWFKLQRFEKVFNASSTRIVTKKGVKWVMSQSVEQWSMSTCPYLLHSY